MGFYNFFAILTLKLVTNLNHILRSGFRTPKQLLKIDFSFPDSKKTLF